MEVQPARRQRIWPAILTLYVLAAIIPECVATYNTAPRSFLSNPALLFYETAFYGSANLLIREVMRRHPRGRVSFLLLGVAFGFVNEGILAGTWYNVVPGGYTLIGGVDWAWAVALTTFHTIYSVIVPILLVETLFPALADRPWLKRRGFIGFGVLLALTTSLAFFAPTYRLARFLVLLAVIALAIIALLLPLASPLRRQRPGMLPGLARLRIAGVAGTILFFCTITLVPAIGVHFIGPSRNNLAQVVYIVLILGVGIVLLNVAGRWSRRSGWGHPQTLALITGALLPGIILSLLLPQMWLAAQPAATLPCLVLLVWLTRRTRTQLPPVWEHPTLKLSE